MDEKEQIKHLRDDLERLIQRYRSEYEITYASVIGVLHVTAFELLYQAHAEDDSGSA